VLSIRRAAREVRVRPAKISDWIANGKLPGYRDGKRTIRVDIDDVVAFDQVPPHRAGRSSGGARARAARSGCSARARGEQVRAPNVYDYRRPMTDRERIDELECKIELLITAHEIEIEARELIETRLDELDAAIWRILRQRLAAR
jgi:excisionase family DNA binding protein